MHSQTAKSAEGSTDDSPLSNTAQNIIGVIIAILFAVFIGMGIMAAHKRGEWMRCRSNLVRISSVKVVAYQSTMTNDVSLSTLFGKEAPICPKGGVYTVGNIGDPPSCSYHGLGL